MPIVRMQSAIGPFCRAKTCSMAARTLERLALPRRMWGGIGRLRLAVVDLAAEAVPLHEGLVREER
jgi:hypothetical protein